MELRKIMQKSEFKQLPEFERTAGYSPDPGQQQPSREGCHLPWLTLGAGIGSRE